MTASGTIRCSAPSCKSVAPIDFLLINLALHTTRIIPIYVWTGLSPDGGVQSNTLRPRWAGEIFSFVFNDIFNPGPLHAANCGEVQPWLPTKCRPTKRMHGFWPANPSFSSTLAVPRHGTNPTGKFPVRFE